MDKLVLLVIEETQEQEVIQVNQDPRVRLEE